MLIEQRRQKHNRANLKWRMKNPSYFVEWRNKHKGYKAPSHSPTYASWCHMKSRCNNPGSSQYRWYGARGIRVCDRWLNSFENFFEDMGERSKHMTLDRIDVNKDYRPSNCRWASWKTQHKNRRSPKEACLAYYRALRKTNASYRV